MSTLGRRTSLAIAGVIILVLGGWLLAGQTRSRTNQPSTDATNARQRYARLYQAAWRQDEGRGSILMTATVLIPPLVDALGRDTSRSAAEDELWRAVKDTAPAEAAIFLTIDSVGGPVSDEAIENSLSLTAAGQTFRFVAWRPLIMPSRVVNTALSTTSQSGLATFTAEQPIDWSTLTDLQLTSRNLGDQTIRKFVWARPGLLNAE